MDAELKSGTRGGTVAVVLNYRTPADSIIAVRSLQQSQVLVSAIVVVDNASLDGSVELLRSSLTDVHIIAAEANGGFSAGCNIGILSAQRRGAERVLLLNSDVIVPPDVIGTLERALTSDHGLGIVGPMLVSRTDPDRVESMGMKYTAVTGRMRHVGSGLDVRTLTAFEQRDVDAVCGCVMLISGDVLKTIGPLAEEYFFGFEDLDFCLRARVAGFRSACVSSAVVLHEGSLSIGRQSPLRAYFATRNHLLLAKRVSRWRWLPFRWAQNAFIVGLNLAHVLITSDVPTREGLRGFVYAVRDHLTGRYGAGSGPELSPESFT